MLHTNIIKVKILLFWFVVWKFCYFSARVQEENNKSSSKVLKSQPGDVKINRYLLMRLFESVWSETDKIWARK